MGGCGHIRYLPFLGDGCGEGLPRGQTISLIIGRICTSLRQTVDKFDLSISAKGLLQCSLDSFTKGKRGACVYQYKDCKVNDAREFIAALAFINIMKSPTSYMYRMIDQVFGPIAKSTTNTGRFPKAVGTDIIRAMSDISGSFYVMLNKSHGMVVLTMLPSELLHAKNSPSRLHAFEAQAVQWVEETRNSKTRMDIDKLRFTRDSSIPGLHCCEELKTKNALEHHDLRRQLAVGDCASLARAEDKERILGTSSAALPTRCRATVHRC
jgi:hypothetical protein